MKALIVDDNLVNLKVAQKLLEHESLEIETVMSGYECLARIKEIKYDVIFMDIMMPKMDGVETLKKLKEDESFNIPVVALTADAEIGAKDKYLKEGFYNYISKPINQNILHDIIENIKKENNKYN